MLRYAPGENPNGSLHDIAGVCNAAGNVFGLMPHPEHAVDPLTGLDRRAEAVRVARAHVASRLTAAVSAHRELGLTDAEYALHRRELGASPTRSSWRCSR